MLNHMAWIQEVTKYPKGVQAIMILLQYVMKWRPGELSCTVWDVNLH